MNLGLREEQIHEVRTVIDNHPRIRIGYSSLCYCGWKEGEFLYSDHLATVIVDTLALYDSKNIELIMSGEVSVAGHVGEEDRNVYEG